MFGVMVSISLPDIVKVIKEVGRVPLYPLSLKSKALDKVLFKSNLSFARIINGG